MAFLASVLGRMLIAVLFIISGVVKLMHVPQTAYLINKATSLSPSLAVPVGVFELVFGVFLAIGFMTRISSLLLFVFTIATIGLFHNMIGDPDAVQTALRNAAVAGGLLMVFAYGQARGSVDVWRERDRARRAEVRAAKTREREAAHAGEAAENRTNGGAEA